MRAPTITICPNGNCAPGAVAEKVLKHLQDRINTEAALSHVVCSTIECFGICHSGPIACIQPGGLFYERLDAALLDRILDEHILQGLPISTHCLLQRNPAPARTRKRNGATGASTSNQT